MNAIQRLLAIASIAVVLLGILAFSAPSVHGAVTVTTISLTDFNQLTSANEAAFSVVYRGGATSGAGAEEIELARNTSTPQVGGGSGTLIGNLTWSNPTDLEVSVDGAGNISARAASTIVGDLQIIRPFNQILVLLYDESVFGPTNLRSLKVNGFDVRNMTADGYGYPGQLDIISITDFGSQSPFSFTANWSPGSFPAVDQQYVQIVALQNATIPEPSSVIMVSALSLMLFRRKR